MLFSDRHCSQLFGSPLVGSAKRSRNQKRAKNLRWRYLFDMVKLLSVRYIIYVIENKINGKSYVGRTPWPHIRHAAHFTSCNLKSPLGKDIRRFGRQAFTSRALDEAEGQREAALKERLFVHLLEANDPLYGYNSPKIYKLKS
jgi:hypothetical protein